MERSAAKAQAVQVGGKKRPLSGPQKKISARLFYTYICSVLLYPKFYFHESASYLAFIVKSFILKAKELR